MRFQKLINGRDAGLVLASLIDHQLHSNESSHLALKNALGASDPRPLKVVELGCGCGISGINLAQTVSNCSVILTDTLEVEAIVGANISEMSPASNSKVSFCALNWDGELPSNLASTSFDVALITDCTYNPDSSPALVETLTSLRTSSTNMIVLVSMKVRHPSELVFFDLMSEAEFVIADHISVDLSTKEDYTEAEERIDFYLFQCAGPSS